jgi:hypothetical protein
VNRPPDPTFTPTAPTYTPGTLNNSDLSGFSYDQLVQKLKDQGYNPADLSGGAVGASTDALVQQLLQHPESMDPQTVATLKAQAKDDLSQMQLSTEEGIKGMSYQTGNQDSNFVASERLASRQGRDQALLASNRAIDLNAAATNQADRRAAAGIGTSYTQSKIDNQFRDAAEKRAAVSLASDTSLRAAALSTDRFALEEQIKQKATELGQSADQTRLQYTLGLMSQITSRYGIDVGAQIDREKLAQAGSEFQQDLIFRLQALQQANEQFAAQYGLDALRLQHQIDQDNYNRSLGK